MDDYKIKIGDIVKVNCNNGMTTISHEAEVKYIPSATGDSWIFKCLQTGLIHYVSEGITVTKGLQTTTGNKE